MMYNLSRMDEANPVRTPLTSFDYDLNHYQESGKKVAKVVFIHAKRDAFDNCFVKSSVKLVTFQKRTVDWTINFGFYIYRQ